MPRTTCPSPLILILILLLLCLLGLSACRQLPPLRETGIGPPAPRSGAESRLGQLLGPLAAAHPGKTGVLALAGEHEALVARALLAAQAQHTLDLQYYIWRADAAGTLLLQALWQAAERGVHVRLLLDDNNTAGLDTLLAALDAHPQIELRLYNPMLYRQARVLNYLLDFQRSNRRMHNKSMTADGQASIVGGRNIGDEYFGAGEHLAFADLDVLAVGAAVPQITASFERYWHSASAYPASQLLPAAAAQDSQTLPDRFASLHAQARTQAYLAALQATPLLRQLEDGQLPLDWVAATLLQDDPAKTLAAPDALNHETLLLPALLKTLGEPVQGLDLVSPYFVPGQAGTAALTALSRRGIRVRVLTNALAASDVAAVHAGYMKWRQTLLRAGVQLFELKPHAGQAERAARGSGGITGSSSASLHAKTFAVDGRRLFVGSFNFDPRSALLNTELGLVLDSPALAGRLSGFFDQELSRQAYRLRLADDGQTLQWLEQTEQGLIVHDKEPGMGLLQGLGLGLLSLLPIDGLL
ncbi:putative cardiolipin synthase [Paucibacter oligotrophus]|uniref:Putative cardiolipin synthase n=1 Tax=Roseateles oligotrophus TaxID=1769250 RepID=A0A840LC81_9BURK|nr:phospholipase D family protein [Roseateles oligotrophus]MBB4844505.1 putative cardiolipin synthase [Roseateles oligotrophus]